MQHSTTLVVILNFQTPELVIDCLESLKSQTDDVPNLVIAVADGGSQDDSVRKISSAVCDRFPGNFLFFDLKENLGFASGNNAIIARAHELGIDPDLYILLNPDTLARPNAIRDLIQAATEIPDADIIGPRLECLDGTVQNSAFRFPGFRSELDRVLGLGVITKLLKNSVVASPPPSRTQQVDWVSGACMLIRRRVFDEIGLLDPGFFMYLEETDFCRRASDARFRTYYVPTARVVHLVGQSGGGLGEEGSTKRLPAYWYASRERYFRKHHGRLKTLAIDAVWLALHPLYRLRRWIQQKPAGLPQYIWWDTLNASFRSDSWPRS